MKYAIITFVLGVGFLSCTKGGGNVYLKGRVYNPADGQGVSNVTIELVKDKPLSGDPINGGGSKVVKSVTSDANGNIELSHTTSLTHNYFYRYSMNGQLLKEMGWDSGVPTNGKEVKKGSNDYDNLKVLPFGVINLKIENVNCEGSEDSMVLYQNHTIDPDYMGSNGWLHTGCAFWEGSSQITAGTMNYEWRVTRNGVTETFYDTVNLIGGQTKTVLIEY